MYKISTLIILLLSLTGCATISATNNTITSHDPIEPVNRAVFKFNTSVDNHVFVPISSVYKKHVPTIIKTGIGNFFTNLDDIPTTLNCVLQGQWHSAAMSLFRFTTNSSIGLLGLIDVADTVGATKEHADFGQTLGHYGVGDGIYLVLPFLGSTNLRDGFGNIVDMQVNPLYPYNTNPEIAAYAVDKTQTRSNYLGFEKIIADQPDPYTFIKSSYYQKRKNLIYYGNPPKMNDDDEDY
jgi:phospholipid-binding lipoprotein MlaA